jgi:hypothetical protein
MDLVYQNLKEIMEFLKTHEKVIDQFTDSIVDFSYS